MSAPETSETDRAALSDAQKLIASDPVAAARAFGELCKRWPSRAAPLIGLASAQYALGEKAASEQLLKLALQVEPNSLAALNNLALLHQSAGRLDEAVAVLMRAHSAAPFDAVISANLIGMLRMQFRHDDAIAHAADWAQARPDTPAAWQALSECTLTHRHGLAAAAAARRLQALRPNGHAAALLARALDAQAEYAAGLTIARDAVARWPHDLDARAALVHLLTSMGQIGEAMRELAVLKAAGPREDRRGLQARLGLLAGPTLAGWRAYEHRFETSPVQMPNLAKQRWIGGDVAGKRIVLVDEQGYGDKIQFARAAWEILARGGEAILYLVPQLAPLFTRLPRGIRFTSELTSADYDLWTPLMSAPLALGNPLAGPNAPYIAPPADRCAPACLQAPGLRIGLAWGGSDLHEQNGLRSCGLAAMTPLLGLPGAAFYSLQLGAPSDEIAARKAGPLLVDLSPHLADWGDTAAAIAALDLVITVDTAIAHLAGAMGKPVWTLVQFAPDWRWGPKGDTTHWYPSMRLYRQTRPKCWRDPIAAINRDLQALLQGGRRPAAAA
jgi:tetratricopeptide (TPR) repeat protein